MDTSDDKYKIKIQEVIDIEPTWSSLNPIVTYRSDGLHYYDNEFEAPASVRGAALKTVVELNEEVHEALISIASEVKQITDNTKPLHKIAEYVADLVNSRDDEKELIQQQTTILQNMQKLMESLVSNTSNPHNNWDAAIQQVGEIRKQGQEWADSIEKNRKHFDHKIDQISKWVLGAILGFGIAIVCLLVFIVINMPIPSSEEDYPSSAEELLLQGDSLLKCSNYKEAGYTYRKAIDSFKKRIAENDNDVEARIQLAKMYYLGKGSFHEDSSYYYVNHKAVRAYKHGRGVYTFILYINGRTDEAKKEISSIGIDENDDFVKLTSALIELSEDSPKQRTTVSCYHLINRIVALGTEEAIYELAIIYCNGIKNMSDEYLIIPHIGLYYNVVKHLAPLAPVTFLHLSTISQFLGRTILAAEYATHAFECGIQDEASLILSYLYANGLYGKSEETSSFLNYVASYANQIDNTVSMGTNLAYYISRGNIDLAIKTADELYAAMKDSFRTETIYLTLTPDKLENLRVTLRLQSEKKEDFEEAVRMAMAKSRCKDSMAISFYLQGVKLAKSYGCTKDTVKSDSLINLSANMGYEEAVYTRLRKADYPTFWVDKEKDVRGYGYLDVGLKCENDDDFIEIGKDAFLEVSKAAIIPESIWRGNEKLTMYLAYYWKDYYLYQGQTSPYELLCPKVYRVLYDLEKTIREAIMKDQALSDSQREHYVDVLLETIPQAYYSRNYTYFNSLCREFCIFAEYSQVPANEVLAYKQFVDNFKDNFSIKPDDPIFAY